MLPTSLAPMLAIDWPAVFTGLLVVAFLFVCVVLILTVLIQRPQGGGLSGAFGSSAGSSQSAFGAKTGDMLTIFTIGIFVLFLFTAVGLNWRISPPAPSAPQVRSLDDVDEQPANGQATPPAQPDDTEPAGLDPLVIPPDVLDPPAEAPATEPPAAEQPTGEEPSAGQPVSEQPPAEPPAEEAPPPDEASSPNEGEPTTGEAPDPQQEPPSDGDRPSRDG